MCGIVGYVGQQDPKTVILSGLKKLEYRGYDSAGVAILDHGKFRRIRAEGKLKNLETKLAQEAFTGGLGIGHTRWATHGVPSERNAHPHQVKGVSLVHNGIIENYAEIRKDLIKRGAEITSDTDSELVAHLLSESLEHTQDLLTSVQEVQGKLKGAFSILAIWEKQPDTLIAFKDGPPLVVGVADDQYFVVSDVQAAIQYTKKFIYLDDREVACIQANTLKIFDTSGKLLNKKISELNWSADLIEKKGYSHFMLKEIYEQPQAVSAAMNPHLLREPLSVRLSRVGFGFNPQDLETLDEAQDWKNTQEVFKKIRRVQIIACGTSYYAGQVGKYLIEKLSRLPVELDFASEYRYRDPIVDQDTLFISISQSGETADTLAAIRLAKARGAVTLSICNVRNSTIDREASGHLYLNAGPEIGVASTKAFSATLVVLNCLSLAIARSRENITSAEEQNHIEALLKLPSQMESMLAYDKYFADAAEELKKYKGFLYMGRGVSYPIAMEGALKLKELAYLHAEGYAAGEMKHGPLALIDEKMAVVMVVPDDELFEKTLSNLEEVKARGGKIIAIGSGQNERLKQLSEQYLSLSEAFWATNPMLAVVPLQLMAFHLAQSLGYDVDQPRNLAKSVTVE